MTKLRFSGGMPYILLSSILWSAFPVLTLVSYQSLSVFTAAALTTLCSTLFFLILVLRRPQRRKVSRQSVRDIAVACITIGCAYYIVTYIGISHTSPGNASIIMLMEIFFSYLFLSVIGKHEPLQSKHVVGAALMVFGALFVLLPSASGVHLGDFILLGGSMIPPLGNLTMKRARREVSAATIMFFRSLTGTISLTVLALFFESLPTMDDVVTALPAVLIGGFFLMGLSKILWIEAIHRLPITQTASVGSIQPLFTMFFAYVILGVSPEWVQFLSLPFIAAGMYLLARKPVVMKVALQGM